MSTQRPAIFLVAQNIRSLFNVGALFRCADVFGVNKVYLCGYTGCPPRSEITKTALGAEGWISWEHCRQTHALLRHLRQAGCQIVVLETGQRSRPLPAFKPRFPLALVVGNEVTGISPAVLKLADVVLEIPMLGRKESLNVAVAAGTALYQLRFCQPPII